MISIYHRHDHLKMYHKMHKSQFWSLALFHNYSMCGKNTFYFYILMIHLNNDLSVKHTRHNVLSGVAGAVLVHGRAPQPVLVLRHTAHRDDHERPHGVRVRSWSIPRVRTSSSNNVGYPRPNYYAMLHVNWLWVSDDGSVIHGQIFTLPCCSSSYAFRSCLRTGVTVKHDNVYVIGCRTNGRVIFKDP